MICHQVCIGRNFLHRPIRKRRRPFNDAVHFFSLVNRAGSFFFDRAHFCTEFYYFFCFFSSFFSYDVVNILMKMRYIELCARSLKFVRGHAQRAAIILYISSQATTFMHTCNAVDRIYLLDLHSM